MKPVKSVVLLAAGALALSACDMNKKKAETSSSGLQNTTRDAGETISEKSSASTANPITGTGTTVTPDQSSTSDGSGAVSPQAAKEDYLYDENLEDDEMTDEIEEEESLPYSSQGTGASDDYEYVDETSSEPNNVKGGRDARMVPRNNGVDNTSSEPDIER